MDDNIKKIYIDILKQHMSIKHKITQFNLTGLRLCGCPRESRYEIIGHMICRLRTVLDFICPCGNY